jgi:hypothetical protein
VLARVEVLALEWLPVVQPELELVVVLGQPERCQLMTY